MSAAKRAAGHLAVGALALAALAAGVPAQASDLALATLQTERQIPNRLAVAVGPAIRDDRDVWGMKFWEPGAVGQIDLAIAGPWGIRLDAATPYLDLYDELRIHGPLAAAMVRFRVSQTDAIIDGLQHRFALNHYGIDLAAGPAAWIGTSSYWEGAYSGAFPGFRLAAGADWRAYRRVGLRLEGGYSGFWGARRFLSGFSTGRDFRAMVQIWAF